MWLAYLWMFGIRIRRGFLPRADTASVLRLMGYLPGRTRIHHVCFLQQSNRSMSVDCRSSNCSVRQCVKLLTSAAGTRPLRPVLPKRRNLLFLTLAPNALR